MTGPWQPIATAPRDGSSFVTANFDADVPEYEIASFDPLIWTNYVEAGDGLYRREEFPVMEFRCDNFHRATHWLALPGRNAASALPVLDGLAIRALRQQRVWTQSQLAEKLGTTKATVSKFENSDRGMSVDWLTRFVDVFGIAP